MSAALCASMAAGTALENGNTPTAGSWKTRRSVAFVDWCLFAALVSMFYARHVQDSGRLHDGY